MEKVVVDSERCLRCGLCVGTAPDTFDYGEDGESVVKNDTVTEQVREVVDMCPVAAISIVEDNTEEEKNEE